MSDYSNKILCGRPMSRISIFCTHEYQKPHFVLLNMSVAQQGVEQSSFQFYVKEMKGLFPIILMYCRYVLSYEHNSLHQSTQ